jgi:hypothetical protein
VIERDDDLDARLRAADPASSLPTADPAWVARLLEDTMSNDVLTESRASGTRNRSPLTWLVAAAAAVIIAGVGVFAVVNGLGGSDDPSGPVAGSDPGSDSGSDPGTSEPTVTELTAPGAEAYTARCAPPSAQLLSTAPVAFDGTVESISDGLVTITPTHWYAGDPTDVVTVEAPSADIQKLLMAVRFEDGGRYLVAANDEGALLVCGFSARYSGSLAALYGNAFAG